MNLITYDKWSGKFRAGFVLCLLLAQIIVAIALQVGLIGLFIWLLDQHTIGFYILIQLLSIINVTFIVTQSKNRCYTVAWMFVIFILPVFGYILHMSWGRSSNRGWKNKNLKPAIKRGMALLNTDYQLLAEFAEEHSSKKKIVNYLTGKGYPLYKNTKCDYFPLGELQFEAMIADIEKAEKFIFLEYFILKTGQLWNRLEEVLIEKAREGVEVRLMIDDFGCILTVPTRLVKHLQANNIQVVRFSPVHKYISRFSINYRNHRKIAVIDGNIAYTGGSNIADEYANIYSKFGHWKDTAIRMEGEAVWSLTVMFLQMWESESVELTDYELYRPTVKVEGKGYFQPFADGPLNNPDNPAETLYRSLINNAKEYVYITTPYLIIDGAMMDALCTTAQGGVDVRILTPKIWDKWYVHMVTESNYGQLLKSGVKIYEYTPGFIHAKSIISDGDNAIIGSINMDYRSFHLCFENGVWICDAPMIDDLKRDIWETCKISSKVEFEEWNRRPFLVRIVEAILRLFSVLL